MKDHSALDEIKCPNCGTLIPVSETISHQIAEKTRAELKAEALRQQKTFALLYCSQSSTITNARRAWQTSAQMKSTASNVAPIVEIRTLRECCGTVAGADSIRDKVSLVGDKAPIMTIIGGNQLIRSDSAIRQPQQDKHGQRSVGRKDNVPDASKPQRLLRHYDRLRFCSLAAVDPAIVVCSALLS